MNEHLTDFQCTYLKDKNSNYIWNGDIIRIIHPKDVKNLYSFNAVVQINGGPPIGYYWQVCYNPSSGFDKVGFSNNKTLKDFMFQYSNFNGDVLTGIEIIGNTKNNPEMLYVYNNKKRLLSKM
jgi:hypothetical protein